jgi:hypothetical protein
MTQSTIDLTNHLGFQLSLLKLATIPGPNNSSPNVQLAHEARQIEALVDRLTPVRKSH